MEAHNTISREIQQIRFEGFTVSLAMSHIADLTSRYHLKLLYLAVVDLN